MDMQFTGKRIIVTGAGKGIGRATAHVLASRGAEIVALARTSADLESLRQEIGGVSIPVDLADAAATRAAMHEAGPSDHLVNCAGTNVLESVLDMTEDGFDAVMDVNLRGALVACQEFARARIAAGGGGSIVNIGSIAGHRGFANHLAYAASKAGLEGASRVLAKELGPHRIRVNVVAPTITLTELAAVAWSDEAKSGPMMVRHPLARFAQAEEVAAAVAMLLSDEAGMLSGAILPVDGGFLAV
jgi:NAD(P)-dependent dehydrogenase (short-subunit alcohol dehydrogenase family)